MDNVGYLFAAFGFAWAIIFLYIFRLFINLNTLSGRIEKMEKIIGKFSESNGGVS